MRTINLTAHDIVLIRCGLLRRMDSMIGREDCAQSYQRSRELLEALFPLARDRHGAILTEMGN